MLRINRNFTLPEEEIEIHAVRSQGAGGQNVNKLSTAVHLRFNVQASSLPPACKDRLLRLTEQRLTKEGVIVIKAQEHRSQEKNRQEALRRLQALLRSATARPKPRKPTRPTRSSQQKRLEAKKHRSQIKSMRKNPL